MNPPHRRADPSPANTRSDRTTLLSIAPSVFLPALIYEIGNGAIAPVIALTALRVGASPGTAGFVLSLLGVGQILGDVPASWLAGRLGERRAMIVAASLSAVASIACFFTPSLILLGAALLLIGFGNAVFYLSRQTYVSEVVAIRLRARALSTLAGAHRIGLFIGPFAGALAISLGGTRNAYLVGVVAAASAALLLLVIPDVEATDPHGRAVRATGSARDMLIAKRQLFATLGIAVVCVGAARAARQTVLPLWAEHIGLSAAQTSIVFGVANAVDMVLFYPSGKVMDRLGRLWIAIPAMSILGGAMVLLPLTHTAFTLAAVAMLMSFGNGIGSGIMMTLGADAAPADARLKFLSIWRLFSDSGNAAGPVIVSVVASFASLGLGIVAAGTTGLLAAAGLGRWVPRYSPYASRAAMAAVRASERDLALAGTGAPPSS